MGYARHIHWRAERILGALALGARFRFAEPSVGYCDRDSGLREVHVTVTRLLPIFALTVTSLVCSCLCLCFCSANVLSDTPPLRVAGALSHSSCALFPIAGLFIFWFFGLWAIVTVRLLIQAAACATSFWSLPWAREHGAEAFDWLLYGSGREGVGRSCARRLESSAYVSGQNME